MGDGRGVLENFTEGLAWTAVYAGHAVGAVFPPDRGSVCQTDVV